MYLEKPEKLRLNSLLSCVSHGFCAGAPPLLQVFLRLTVQGWGLPTHSSPKQSPAESRGRYGWRVAGWVCEGWSMTLFLERKASILPWNCGLSHVADISPGLSNISQAPAWAKRQFISCVSALQSCCLVALAFRVVLYLLRGLQCVCPCLQVWRQGVGRRRNKQEGMRRNLRKWGVTERALCPWDLSPRISWVPWAYPREHVGNKGALDVWFLKVVGSRFTLRM